MINQKKLFEGKKIWGSQSLSGNFMAEKVTQKLEEMVIEDTRNIEIDICNISAGVLYLTGGNTDFNIELLNPPSGYDGRRLTIVNGTTTTANVCDSQLLPGEFFDFIYIDQKWFKQR